MSQSQISVQSYPAVDGLNNIIKDYIYSKAMPTDDAIRISQAMIADINDGVAFIWMEKEEGRIYIRAGDIKTILVKEATYAHCAHS